jgi:hypothetical protein
VVVVAVGFPLARRDHTDSVGSRLECGNGSRLSVLIYRGGIFLTGCNNTTIDTVPCKLFAFPSIYTPGEQYDIVHLFSLNKNNLQSYIL